MVKLQELERKSSPFSLDDRMFNVEPIRYPTNAPPVLFVVVDTEEEFNWRAPISRDQNSVRAMRHIHRVHTLLTRYGVRPCYVIDFPVAHQRDGYGPLKELLDSGTCTIGAHLHPWVNPPFDEAVSRRNSFGCNLGLTLETKKIQVLRAEIAAHLGVNALVYKAGRYGFGASTAHLLEDLGFDVDASVIPHMNYSTEGGPSFEEFEAAPFWFGRHRRLMEIPCSVGYTGIAGRHGRHLHRLGSTPPLRRAHLVGIMARLGIVNKLMLSPEGFTRRELRSLTRSLLARGIRTFSLTFHSPSIEPGHTPYVRTRRDLQKFLARIESFCEFFFGDLNGLSTTPEAFHAATMPTPAIAGTASLPEAEGLAS